MNAIPLTEVIPYIDWSPFFSTWEIHGRYPDLLKDERTGAEAVRLFADAQTLLTRIQAENLFNPRAVLGVWPANSVTDDVEVYQDETRSKVLGSFRFLRQQQEKPEGQHQHCLADYVAPKTSGRIDYMGGFAVTAGSGVEELASRYKAAGDDYTCIMTQALGDRIAEAMAEYLHKQFRDLCGFGLEEKLSIEEIIREKYRGIRPAPGYPACPEHTEKRVLFTLLEAETATGIRLTESYAMHPGSSVSGFYLNHAVSKYFAVGKIGRDQAEDYAKRKGWSMVEAEKWLAPCLE